MDKSTVSLSQMQLMMKNVDRVRDQTVILSINNTN